LYLCATNSSNNITNNNNNLLLLFFVGLTDPVFHRSLQVRAGPTKLSKKWTFGARFFTDTQPTVWKHRRHETQSL